MSMKQRPTNSPSMLLNQSENDTMFTCIGKGCVTLASGVVQLYLADHSDRTRWNKRCCGVACFVKDNPNRSYFIRIFDIKKGQQIWEQELYNQFRYKSPREYFHTFEGHSSAVGLNFASEDEALKFKNAVDGKLQERATRRREKKRQTTVHGPHGGGPPSRPPNTAPTPQHNNMMAPAPATPNMDMSNKNDVSSKKKGKDKDKDKSKKLTKADIGAPTEFRHVSHVGWDPNKGFDMNNLDPDMKQLFSLVGIDKEGEIDKDTVDFIYDFVEKSGGMDVLREEMKQRPPPPPPPSGGGSRGLPPPPNRSLVAPPPPSRTGAPPPPPPSRTGNTPGRTGAPPPPPLRNNPPATQRAPNAAPPPPPPPSSAPRAAPPPPPPLHSRSMPPPPPPTMGGPPPPPPPPPAAGPPPPPPPPPPPGSGGFDLNGGGESGGESGGSGRGNLLAAIHAGKRLKRVEESDSAPARPANSRGQLLDAIRQGAALKRVEDQDDRSLEAEPDDQDGLVGALARALASRRPMCVDSDDEGSSDDEEEDDDDEEWDD